MKKLITTNVDPFERFNIKYLSPTMISQWDTAPVTLILKRVFGIKGKATPSMWRGDAVEGGLLFYLANKADENVVANAKVRAEEVFWHRADGVIDEEAEKVAAQIPGMVENAIEACKDINSRLLGTQLRVEHFFDDVRAPVTGNLDFIFEDGTIVELKTTTRCPSKEETISTSHIWQASLYASARKHSVRLTYVTDKKFNTFEIKPDHPKMKLMRYAALALQEALAKCEDGVNLLKSMPLNPESFYWDEELLEAYDKAMAGEMNALIGPGSEGLAAQGYVTFGKHAGKHISDLPESYLKWLLDPKLSNGDVFDVPAELQDAIRDMHNKAA